MAALQHSLPAVFARGGTSNALIIQRSILPAERREWQPILAAAMGSPDQYGRQLNGMGSGVSSTSKVCVIEPSQRGDADVDYTFVQVDIKTGELDFAGNCGNMSSAIGPVALDEGIVDPKKVSLGSGIARVRIFNTNTSKIIHSTFATKDDGARFQPRGNFGIDGVPGTNSRITLAFVDPAGSRTGKALPTGNTIDLLCLKDGRRVLTSLIDVTTPVVYVWGVDVGIRTKIRPDQLEARPDVMALLEDIRQVGARAMGLDPSAGGVPKLLMLLKPQGNVQIEVIAISMQQPHRAIPVTVALNVSAAIRLAGTLPTQALSKKLDGDDLEIGHPSGTITVSCAMRDGVIASASVYRTARVLMKGEIMLD